MTNIKTTILSGNCSDIFDTVNEFIFKDGVYHPDNDLIYRRAIILGLFAPDYMKDKNNSADAVFAEEADDIIKSLEENSRQYKEVTTAIDRWINHRLRNIESSNSSSFENSLTKLLDTLNSKAEQIEITQESLNAFIAIADKVNSPEFEGNLVDAFNERGMLENKTKKPKVTKSKTTSKKKTTRNKPPIELKTDKE